MRALMHACVVLRVHQIRCRFLPAVCPEYCPVLLDEDGAVRETGAKKDTRRLEFSSWQLAWERYSLAAAILKQLTFITAMKHKAVVTEVAASAKAEGRLPILGVFFDE